MSKHTVVLDWDGTLVPARWPEQPREWMPGAVEAVKALHAAGVHMKVQSARMNPYDPVTFQHRGAAAVEHERQYIREMLDSAGLSFVDIWTLEGKASGEVYVDDKGMRYGGRPGSWAKLVPQILMRLETAQARFPTFDQSIAKGGKA